MGVDLPCILGLTGYVNNTRCASKPLLYFTPLLLQVGAFASTGLIPSGHLARASKIRHQKQPIPLNFALYILIRSRSDGLILDCPSERWNCAATPDCPAMRPDESPAAFWVYAQNTAPAIGQIHECPHPQAREQPMWLSSCRPHCPSPLRQTTPPHAFSEVSPRNSLARPSSSSGRISRPLRWPQNRLDLSFGRPPSPGTRARMHPIGSGPCDTVPLSAERKRTHKPHSHLSPERI